MHSQEQELQRYFDGELGAEEKARVEKHLAQCSTCQARLGELQALTTILQSWTVPSSLTRLTLLLSLPARETNPQADLGLIGWTSGIVIVLLFVVVRAIFWLSNQLNWATDLVSTFGINGRVERLTSTLWGSFSVHPFYLSYLGELGEGIMSVLMIILPLLLYVVSVGVIAILYFNWFSLIWISARQSNKIRS